MEIIEGKVYSQNGEDGVIQHILAAIPPVKKFFVEIGCGDGTECNTRYLAAECGWQGFKFDQEHEIGEARIYRRLITPHNILPLLHIHGAPLGMGLLSVDIDCNDWHVLYAVLKGSYQPAIIVAEYNAHLGPSASLTVPPEQVRWCQDNYFGASYKAFVDLGKRFGYHCVYAEDMGVNLFLVHEDYFAPPKDIFAYKPAGYPPYRMVARAFVPTDEYLG